MADDKPQVEACRWCGNTHGVRCPIVRALWLDARGRVRQVEFFAPNDYHPTFISGLNPWAPRYGEPVMPVTVTFDGKPVANAWGQTDVVGGANAGPQPLITPSAEGGENAPPKV